MHDFTFLGEGEASLGDCLYLESYSNLPLPDGTPVNAIFLKFSDPDGGAIDSTALPTSAPDLGDWQSCTLSIQGPDEFVAEGQPFGHMFDIEAAVTSATLSADPYDPLLPEPGTLPLLGVGFAALAWHGKLTFARSDKSTLAHEDEVRIKV